VLCQRSKYDVHLFILTHDSDASSRREQRHPKKISSLDAVEASSRTSIFILTLYLLQQETISPCLRRKSPVLTQRTRKCDHECPRLSVPRNKRSAHALEVSASAYFECDYSCGMQTWLSASNTRRSEIDPTAREVVDLLLLDLFHDQFWITRILSSVKVIAPPNCGYECQ
jgi:hypothetical protein